MILSKLDSIDQICVNAHQKSRDQVFCILDKNFMTQCLNIFAFFPAGAYFPLSTATIQIVFRTVSTFLRKFGRIVVECIIVLDQLVGVLCKN